MKTNRTDIMTAAQIAEEFPMLWPSAEAVWADARALRIPHYRRRGGRSYRFLRAEIEAVVTEGTYAAKPSPAEKHWR